MYDIICICEGLCVYVGISVKVIKDVWFHTLNQYCFSIQSLFRSVFDHHFADHWILIFEIPSSFRPFRGFLPINCLSLYNCAACGSASSSTARCPNPYHSASTSPLARHSPFCFDDAKGNANVCANVDAWVTSPRIHYFNKFLGKEQKSIFQKLGMPTFSQPDMDS